MIRNLPRTLMVLTMLALSGAVVQPQTPPNHTPTAALSRSAKAANLTTSPETVGLSSERLERISRRHPEKHRRVTDLRRSQPGGSPREDCLFESLWHGRP